MARNTPASIHEEETLGKAYDAELMRRLLRYLRPYGGRVVLAVGLLVGSSLIALVGPWLTKEALDRAIPQEDPGLLALLAGAYLASIVIGFALDYGQRVLTTWLGQSVMYDLREEIFGHLQRLSLSFYDRNPVGRLMTRITNDVEVLNRLFSSGIVTVFGDLFTLVFIVGAMLLMDWRLALVSFTVLPLVGLAAFFFRTRIRKAYRAIRVRLARINAYLQERITGISVIQLFGREEETARRFVGIDRDYLDAHLRSITYYALFFPVMEVLTAVALALIIAYGGAQILGGTLTVGVVAAFLQYARRFFRPIQDLSEKYNMLQGAMASSERIFRLLDTEPHGAGPERPAADPDEPIALPESGRGEIEFRNVWFAYQRRAAAAESDGATGEGVPAPADAVPATSRDGGEPTPPEPRPRPGDGMEPGEAPWDWVLRDVSFKVRPGERLAIVGHTGAGKTTIINLLLRFYEPQRGEILFDGIPIDRVPARRLRQRIGLVLQDIFLFSRDVASNIRLGRSDIDDARIRAAAARVGADAFVDELPGGYEQPLGERGASLSVGQRQLLSFARALAFDPLVLVLDEATSSVDSELEEQIQLAVDALMHDRTSIVIAHRLSTVQNADRILVMHHGAVREQGSHQELLRRDGLYARLHELQFVRPMAVGE